jgi:hypothetical protein
VGYQTGFLRRWSSRALGIGVLVAALTLSGCSAAGTDEHPPAAVVEEYLNAIAEGDATTASRLDADAVAKETENKTVKEDGDLTALRTDAVLMGAEERISDIDVESVKYQWLPKLKDGDKRRIDYSYSVDGQKHSSSMGVRWDAKADRWILTDSLTMEFDVGAEQSSISSEYVSFTIPGVDRVLSPTPERPPFLYLIYPGVYSVTAQFDPALLQPGAEIQQRVVVSAPGGFGADFAVTKLPSE